MAHQSEIEKIKELIAHGCIYSRYFRYVARWTSRTSRTLQKARKYCGGWGRLGPGSALL